MIYALVRYDCDALSSHGDTTDLVFSNDAILSDFCMVSPISSNPLRRQCLRKASISKATEVPSALLIVCVVRSISKV